MTRRHRKSDDLHAGSHAYWEALTDEMQEEIDELKRGLSRAVGKLEADAKRDSLPPPLEAQIGREILEWADG